MPADIENEFNDPSFSLPVGDFSTSPAPDPSGNKKDDLSAILAKLNKNIELANKRQEAAKKARDTILQKSDDDKFKKVALKLAEGRLGKANEDVEELRRQLFDIQRTNEIRNSIIKDQLSVINSKENEIVRINKDSKREDIEEKVAFKEALEIIPTSFKDIVTDNEMFLGSLAGEFSTIVNTVTSGWSKLTELGQKSNQFFKFTSGLFNTSNFMHSDANEAEGEYSEVNHSENSGITNSYESENNRSDYTLREAVDELKRSNAIDTTKIIKSDVQLAANHKKVMTKSLDALKRGVNKIRQSLAFQTMLGLVKLSIPALLVSSVAQLADSVKKIINNGAEIAKAISHALEPIKETFKGIKLALMRAVKGFGNAFIDTFAAKIDSLAENRSKNYSKAYDIKSYGKLSASEDLKVKASYAEIKARLAKDKKKIALLEQLVSKAKSSGDDAEWAIALEAQRSYIQDLLEDDSLSILAREYLSGSRFDELSSDYKETPTPGPEDVKSVSNRELDYQDNKYYLDKSTGDVYSGAEHKQYLKAQDNVRNGPIRGVEPIPYNTPEAAKKAYNSFKYQEIKDDISQPVESKPKKDQLAQATPQITPISNVTNNNFYGASSSIMPALAPAMA